MTGGVVESGPAVADGVVYTGSWDNKVYALSTFGNPTASFAGIPAIATTTAPAPVAEPEPSFPLPVVVLVIAGIMIIAGGGFVVRRWHVRKKKPSLLEEQD